MLDHPVTQKVLATVAAATVVAIGGSGWSTQRKVDQHDQKIVAIEKIQDETITELKSELQGMRSDIAEIKTGVAVLKERTERYDDSIGHSGH
jgi:uncharacterized protein YdgA (DUF945 family)